VKPLALFVTIGQTPRVDLVPEMREWLGDSIDVVERGALDGLTREAIQAMAPAQGDPRLVTRLVDGTEAIVRKDLVFDRLQRLFDEVAGENLTCTVLLCTGHFPPFRIQGLFLEAQSIVDQTVAVLAGYARSIGVMVPVQEQIAEFHFRPAPDQRLIVSHASPYTPGRLEEAAAELSATDMIVMHCMGFTEAMRRTVARTSGRPVLLARRIVAAAVAQLA
jgi:protein AroM